jgi:hypothetical protein
MSGRGIRSFLLLAGVVGLGYWIYEKHPTFSGIIDDLTRPVLGSPAAVTESERKRVVGEASQIVAVGEEKPVGALYVGMSEDDVRNLMGDPDKIERLEDERGDRIRWTYRLENRVILLKNHRVLSIAVR